MVKKSFGECVNKKNIIKYKENLKIYKNYGILQLVVSLFVIRKIECINKIFL